MKRQAFLIGVILTLVAEIIALVVFATLPLELSGDTLSVNEVLQTVTQNFDSLSEYENPTNLKFVVIDREENVLYKTESGLSESINRAISHRDTILDIAINEEILGKIIIYNDGEQFLQTSKQNAVIVLAVAICLSFLLCIGCFLYMHYTVTRPFKKLKGFAERIAGGNLDIPLEMDKRNLFGAFTESFDIMRSELKKARLSEAQANASKKELVAKLSHDIKTPVASIKAVSEVGLTLATSEKDRANYTQIIGKADQINTLVNNLFSATLEELQQLSVVCLRIESKKVKTMLENADYMHRATIADIPDCLLYADALRLQQVFDNIFSNAYKYAKTKIEVRTQESEKFLKVCIEDFGGGVKSEELRVLKEKYKRGSNATNIEGAGLGLFISDYFMKEMRGELNVENSTHGLLVTVLIALG